MSESESLEKFLENVATESWDTFRRDPLLYVLAAVLVFVVSAVSLGIMAGPLTVGFCGLVRRRRAGEAVQVSSLFDGLDKFGASFFIVLLVALAVLVGSLLLIVPGVLAALFSTFALPALAYEGGSAFDALGRSIDIVRKNFLFTLVLAIALAVLQSLGSAVVFGALLTAPLGLIALTLAFARLRGSVSHSLTEAL